MKKRFAISAAVLLIASLSWAGGPGSPPERYAFKMIGTMATAAPAPTYPDILFYHGFETSTTCASDNAAKPNIAPQSCSGTPTHVADPKVGTYSFGINANYEYMRFPITSGDIANHLLGRAGFWVKLATYTQNNSLFMISYNTNTDHIMVKPQVTSGSHNGISLIYRSGNVGSGAYCGANGGQTNEVYWDGSSYVDNITTNVLGQWQYVEVAWDKANEDYRCYVNGFYAGNRTGSGIGNSGTWGGAPTYLFIGDGQGNNAYDAEIDQVLVSNDFARDLYAIKNFTSFP